MSKDQKRQDDLERKGNSGSASAKRSLTDEAAFQELANLNKMPPDRQQAALDQLRPDRVEVVINAYLWDTRTGGPTGHSAKVSVTGLASDNGLIKTHSEAIKFVLTGNGSDKITISQCWLSDGKDARRERILHTASLKLSRMESIKLIEQLAKAIQELDPEAV